MKRPLRLYPVLLACILFSSWAAAQQLTSAQVQPAQAEDRETLIVARRAISAPAERLRISGLGDRTVRNGDASTEAVADIVVQSFAEQADFAERMNKAQLIRAGALVALPEVDDEVLVFDDAYVIRRSTTIIVKDPAAVARESALYRDYLGSRTADPSLALTAPAPLDAEERAGLRAFRTSGVNDLHPDDPLRAAAARGDLELLDAIAGGQGELTVEDTLIIPRVAGVDLGGQVAIPAIRNGVFDLKNPVPVPGLSIQARPAPPSAVAPIQAVPAKPPKRMPPDPQPKAEASGKHTLTGEFLLGATRTANFQWERKWKYTSGFFRVTLGAGYAFGYRIPVVARATVEPTQGYIQDYSDKKVIIGAVATVNTTNGNAAYFRRTGLPDSLVKGGDELLFEANVGWGYKFRALWKDLAHRPYTTIGVSYSQGFRPPASGGNAESRDFALLLDPKKTKLSVEGTFLGGSATFRFDGAAWGRPSVQLQTLVDNKTQRSFDISADKHYAQGVYPFKMTLNPIPLRAGTTLQNRPFGVRLANPEYVGRLVIVPSIQLAFRVGYKRLKREFKTGWIPFMSLKIDTGNQSWPVHQGTSKSARWNGGVKTYRRIEKPTDTGRFRTNPGAG